MDTVALYLMNQKGLSVLSAVLEKFGPGIISAVVTAKDGAMAKDYYEEIVSLASQYNIPIHEKNSADISEAKFKIAIGWRWIIPDDNNLVVLHDSLLPRYRGFAPLVNALINGENELGVTALFATAEYDRGDIIEQLSIAVKYPVKIAGAIEQTSALYEKIVVRIIEKILSGKPLQAYQQEENKASYSLWREEADYQIDWNKSAQWIKRFIDAVGFPFKGASTNLYGQIVRLVDAEEMPDVKIENRDPGKIIFMHDGKPVVVCGQGLLKLIAITNEGGESLLPFNKFRVRFG